MTLDTKARIIATVVYAVVFTTLIGLGAPVYAGVGTFIIFTAGTWIFRGQKTLTDTH